MMSGQKVGYQEMDSPPSPPVTRFRRPRLILSLGRLVYQGNSTALAGGGYFYA